MTEGWTPIVDEDKWLQSIKVVERRVDKSEIDFGKGEWQDVTVEYEKQGGMFRRSVLPKISGEIPKHDSVDSIPKVSGLMTANTDESPANLLEGVKPISDASSDLLNTLGSFTGSNFLSKPPPEDTKNTHANIISKFKSNTSVNVTESNYGGGGLAYDTYKSVSKKRPPSNFYKDGCDQKNVHSKKITEDTKIGPKTAELIEKFFNPKSPKKPNKIKRQRINHNISDYVEDIKKGADPDEIAKLILGK